MNYIAPIVALGLCLFLLYGFIHFVWIKPYESKLDFWLQQRKHGFPAGNNQLDDAPAIVKDNFYDYVESNSIEEAKLSEAWVWFREKAYT